ncbi:glycosyltransferase family 2 protein [Dokdonella ginsengisoli]|uniref:Glycosyltransferase family 2 protein n=1 Tax=Dokdonella ginsengisoli TaxID=363846 RepID=A0ABV9QR19_9GAMM
MFSFVRHLLRPSRARLRPPLRAAAWNGTQLRLEFEPGHADTVALDLDGAYFAQSPLDAHAHADFTFAFAPSGHDWLQLMPRRGRDGEALAERPLHVRLGSAGIGAADAPPPPLAPPAAAAQPVPFGVDAAAAEVAIVVPVYDAPELVGRCLDSVLAWTTGRVRLIVVDDASPDPRIAPLLARYARVAGVEVLRIAENRGFTATANRGIDAAGRADVVLLNADTEVGPNWLTGLRRAAHARDDVGTATAVSDNAGAFSVPELEQANELPPGWSFERAARTLWQQAGLAYPALPTGNGFCLYIRRAVIERVGKLDEAAFPQGYGEENDFCQRAAQAGLRHLIAGNVLVRHARSASFGEERRRRLGEAGMAVLRERWPDYEAEVGRTLFSFERRVLDWRVRRAFADAAAARPRLLWVGANAPSVVDADVWTLRANGERNELVAGGRVVAANLWRADDAETSYRALWDWLQLHAIEGLLVAERKESAAEIVCRLLDIPILPIDPARTATPAELFAGARRFAKMPS